MERLIRILLPGLTVCIAGLFVTAGLFIQNPANKQNSSSVEKVVAVEEGLPENTQLYFSETPEDEIVGTPDGISKYGDHELIVQMEYGTTEDAAIELAAQYNAELAGFISLAGTCQWRFAEAKTWEELEKLCEILTGEGALQAMPNYIIEGTEASLNEPAYASTAYPKEGEEWNKKSSWNPEDVKEMNWGYMKSEALYAWQNQNLMTEPVKVAVLDAGFQEHEDLNYTQYLYGEESNSAHGTHVMGIIGAECANGKGMTGIYPKAAGNLMAYDVSGNTMKQHYAMADAVARGAKVLNLSMTTWGNDEDIIACNAAIEGHGDSQHEYYMAFWARQSEYVLRGLINSGYEFLVVIAAGNQSDRPVIGTMGKCEVVVPEAVHFSLYIQDKEVKERIICASAYNRNEKIAYFANMGERVDILAPGMEIWSTCDGNLKKMQGTSQAAPYVTGALACVWSMDSDMKATQVRNILLDSCWLSITDEAAKINKPVLNVKLAMLTAQKELYGTETEVNEPEGQETSETQTETERTVPVLFTVKDAESGTETVKYVMLIENQDGEKQKYTPVVEEDLFENVFSGILTVPTNRLGYAFLLPGSYHLIIQADGYLNTEMDIQVEDNANALQEWTMELYSAKVSAPLDAANGTTWICEAADGGQALEELSENCEVLEEAAGTVVWGENKLIMKPGDSGSAYLEYVRLEQGEVKKSLVASDAAAGAPFVCCQGDMVYYFNTSGCLMAVNIKTEDPAECIFDPAEYGVSADAYAGGIWRMDICRQDGGLYFLPGISEGTVYRMDMETRQIEIYQYSSGKEAVVCFQTDGLYVYTGSTDGTLIRYRLDGSTRDEGEILKTFASPAFALYEDLMYLVKDGGLHQISLYIQMEEELAQSRCSSIVCESGSRIYFRRNREEDGQFTGYEYYSCTLDGLDEQYHGYRPFESETETGFDWQTYLNETIIPQSSRLGTAGRKTVDYMDAEQIEDAVAGLYSADIWDYDGDGQEELATVSVDVSILQDQSRQIYSQDTLQPDRTVFPAIISEVLQIYDLDENGDPRVADSQDIQYCTDSGYLNKIYIGSIFDAYQTGLFRYVYDGKTYFVADGFQDCNGTDSACRILSYDGTEIVAEAEATYTFHDEPRDNLGVLSEYGLNYNRDRAYHFYIVDLDMNANPYSCEPSQVYTTESGSLTPLFGLEVWQGPDWSIQDSNGRYVSGYLYHMFQTYDYTGMEAAVNG